MRKKKKDEVVSMLVLKKYDVVDNDLEYKYLTKMPMDSVTEENIAKIYKECGNKEHELNQLKETSANAMWTSELDKLTQLYTEYKMERERLHNGDVIKKKSIIKKTISKSVTSKKILVVSTP